MKLTPDDEEASTIDLSQLTQRELGLMLVSYEDLVRVMKEANNTLIYKLAAAPGFTNEHGRIISDWSAFYNELFDRHTLQMEMATAVVN